jgi:hypothetical protein
MIFSNYTNFTIECFKRVGNVPHLIDLLQI